MNKQYGFLILIFFSCNGTAKKTRVVERFEDGNIKIMNEYLDPRDTSNYLSNVYFHNGTLHQTVEFKHGMFINKKVTYFENKNIYQIDSLYTPQKRNDKNWTGEVTRYFSNGKIAQRYKILNGKMSGLFQNFNDSGLIWNEYEVIDTI